MGYVARVGIILTVAAVLLGAMFFLLEGYYAQAKSYPIWVIFDNALGVQKGAPVRMAGVDVGQVGDTALTPDNRAQVQLNIDKKYGIPKGSKFTIASGAIIGDKFIDILPARTGETIAKDAIIDGPDQVRKPVQIEDVAGQASKLIGQFQELSEHLNHVVGNPEVQRDIAQSMANLARTTARAEELILGAQGIIVRNQVQVDRMMGNLVEASSELRNAMADVRVLTTDPEVRSDVASTADSLRTASERLDAVIQDVRDVTADPDVGRNLRETAENMAQATAQARDMTERVNKLFGSGRPRITFNLPRPQFQSGTRFILESAGSGAGKVRTDLTLTIPTGKESGLRLGLYDFTESNRLIAQRIRWLDPKTAMRYGLYSGRLSVGMDYDASKRLNLTADLYDPKYPRMDLRGHYYYTSDLGLVFGVDSILRNPRAIVGLQWRK
ncbi:MAG: MCE family protein [Armatimonadetes bacterium]|nr:MCE family protein [Armatimonadota bacterium]